MTTNATKRHSLRLTLLAGAAALALSACGATGGGAGSSPAPASVTASQPATAAPGSTHSMDPGTGASSMGAGSTGAAEMATIHIKSFAYTGPDSVPAGATVMAMNMDSEAHTVTADDGSFDAVVKAGTSITFTAPKKPGAYAYHCSYHSNMHGTLTVR